MITLTILFAQRGRDLLDLVNELTRGPVPGRDKLSTGNVEEPKFMCLALQINPGNYVRFVPL